MNIKNIRKMVSSVINDFVAKNEDILKKHHLVAMGHKSNIACKFFSKGFCRRGRYCKFEHKMTNNQTQPPILNQNQQFNQQQQQGTYDSYNDQQQQNFTHSNFMKKQCKFKENCYKFPDCGFVHGEICKYQDKCFKPNQCRFVHFDQHFLGMNFPPMMRQF